MTGYPWLVLIGIAVALLFTWLLLIERSPEDAPRARRFSWRQRTVGFRRAVPCPIATEGCGWTAGSSGARHPQRGLVVALAVPRTGRAGGGGHLHSACAA